MTSRVRQGRGWGLGLALLCLSAPPLRGVAVAQAQVSAQAPAPPTTVQGVTVQPEPTPHIAFNRALNFVQSHGAPTRSGQLARWGDPVCVITYGLPPDMDAFVTGRVETLVAKVGAPRRRSNRCKPNVEILFTSEPQALMDAIARKRSALLGFHYVSQTRQMAAMTHVVEARYLTQTHDDNGHEALDIASGPMSGASLGAVTAPMDLATAGNMPGGCAGSAFTRCLTSSFSNVLIVVDGKALDGRRIGPVADYVAMLALSQARSLDGCEALPSIIDLLSKACADRPAPATWTDADIAYLQGLYKTSLETKFWVEKDSIANRMTAAPKPTGDAAAK